MSSTFAMSRRTGAASPSVQRSTHRGFQGGEVAAKRVPPELPLPVRRAGLERLFAQMVDRVLAKLEREEAEANELAAGEGNGTEGPGVIR